MRGEEMFEFGVGEVEKRLNRLDCDVEVIRYRPVVEALLAQAESGGVSLGEFCDGGGPIHKT
jgi:hypothetical protein